jgi:hypothetical protein
MSFTTTLMLTRRQSRSQKKKLRNLQQKKRKFPSPTRMKTRRTSKKGKMKMMSPQIQRRKGRKMTMKSRMRPERPRKAKKAILCCLVTCYQTRWMISRMSTLISNRSVNTNKSKNTMFFILYTIFASTSGRNWLVELEVAINHCSI